MRVFGKTIDDCIPKEKWHRYTLNITGERYNKLVVIGMYGRLPSGRTIRWLCQCDCGGQNLVTRSKLKSGEVTSCGCVGGFSRFKGEKQARLPDGYAAFRKKLGSVMSDASKSNKPFTITEDEAFRIMKLNCFYCNSEPNQVQTVYDNTGDFVYNGIDRYNSMFGYEPNNCVAACKNCNIAKTDLKPDDFYAWAERFGRFQGWIE